MFYSAGWRSGAMAGTGQLWLTDFIWSTGILQALGWNSWWNKPKHQSDVQTWEISDISTGERHGNSGYWCSSWDPNTLIFALKTPFLPHIFSVLLGFGNYLWNDSCCPLSCSCPFCLLSKFIFLKWSSVPTPVWEVEGIYAFPDAPGMPYTRGICQSRCCCLWCSWELFWPCLQVDRADTRVRI